MNKNTYFGFFTEVVDAAGLGDAASGCTASVSLAGAAGGAVFGFVLQPVKTQMQSAAQSINIEIRFNKIISS
jgi:hypothetical protein